MGTILRSAAVAANGSDIFCGDTIRMFLAKLDALVDQAVKNGEYDLTYRFKTESKEVRKKIVSTLENLGYKTKLVTSSYTTLYEKVYVHSISIDWSHQSNVGV